MAMPQRQPAMIRRRRDGPASGVWLMTDRRLADHGIGAARRLPPGSNVVVRSDELPTRARHRLVSVLRRIARARRLTLWLAGTPALAARWGCGGVHLRCRSHAAAARARRLGLSTSAPVHGPGEARAVARARIGHALISPVFPTASHPGAPALGSAQFARLARVGAPARPVALGGMTPAAARRQGRRTGCTDWAGISGLAVRP